MTGKMTFDTWFENHTWFGSAKRLSAFRKVWDDLIDHGYTEQEAAEHLDTVIHEIRDEYGD